MEKEGKVEEITIEKRPMTFILKGFILWETAAVFN